MCQILLPSRPFVYSTEGRELASIQGENCRARFPREPRPVTVAKSQDKKNFIRP